MGAEAAMAVSWDGAAAEFRVMRAAGRLSREYATGAIPVGGGPVSSAVREARPVTTGNILTDPRMQLSPERRAQIEREGYKAVAAATLASKGRVHGALVVHYWTERTFDDDEIGALALLAESAALAIDNARLYADATRRATRLRDLADVSQAITALGTTDAMQRIADAAAAQAPGALAAVHVLDAERLVLRSAASSGAGWESLRELLWQALRRRLGEPARGVPGGRGAAGARGRGAAARARRGPGEPRARAPARVVAAAAGRDLLRRAGRDGRRVRRRARLRLAPGSADARGAGGAPPPRRAGGRRDRQRRALPGRAAAGGAHPGARCRQPADLERARSRRSPAPDLGARRRADRRHLHLLLARRRGATHAHAHERLGRRDARRLRAAGGDLRRGRRGLGG